MIASTPSDERIVEILNESFPKGRNPSVVTLRGKVVYHNREKMIFGMTFIGDSSFSRLHLLYLDIAFT
jgi:hypothetical protein